MRAAALLLVAASGSSACRSSPCDDVSAACIELHVESATVDRIDQLELDVRYNDRHGTKTTSDGVVELPLITSIELPANQALDVGVVAAGKLSGVVLGTGAASRALMKSAHVELMIELSPIADCQAGAFYCGGDKLAGDASTLYQCNGGGVPLARGKCLHGCIVTPTQDDACDAGPDVCQDGGFYCGGDKLVGDPQSLYRCSAGKGIDRVECTDGCVIAPEGSDDHCR